VRAGRELSAGAVLERVASGGKNLGYEHYVTLSHHQRHRLGYRVFNARAPMASASKAGSTEKAFSQAPNFFGLSNEFDERGRGRRAAAGY